jgi:hypothetical protein
VVATATELLLGGALLHVLAAGGRTVSFSARGGTETKMQLLRIEGAGLL